MDQRGGAGATGEGHHLQGGAGGGGGEQGDGVVEHLAVADRTGGAAVLLPEGRAGDHGPAELIGSGGDGLIGTARGAMEQGEHAAAGADLQQVNGDARDGPGELRTTTGHDHQLTSCGNGTGRANGHGIAAIRAAQCGGYWIGIHRALRSRNPG